MSTSYNNQWVLVRARSRWRRRAPAADSGTIGQTPAALPREPHERQPSPTPPQHVRPPYSRRVRKRPRWIDRDT